MASLSSFISFQKFGRQNQNELPESPPAEVIDSLFVSQISIQDLDEETRKIAERTAQKMMIAGTLEYQSTQYHQRSSRWNQASRFSIAATLGALLLQTWNIIITGGTLLSSSSIPIVGGLIVAASTGIVSNWYTMKVATRKLEEQNAKKEFADGITELSHSPYTLKDSLQQFVSYSNEYSFADNTDAFEQLYTRGRRMVIIFLVLTPLYIGVLVAWGVLQ